MHVETIQRNSYARIRWTKELCTHQDRKPVTEIKLLGRAETTET